MTNLEHDIEIEVPLACDTKEIHHLPEDSIEDLVRRVQEKDYDAFSILQEKFAARLHGFLVKMVPHHHDLEDLKQDIWLRVWTNIGGFEGKSSFYTWLCAVGRNLTLNFLKKRKKEIGNVSLDDEEVWNHDFVPEELAVRSTVATDIDRAALMREVEEFAIQRFDTQRQHILAMHLAGKSYGEIGRKFGLNEGTVRSRVHYMKKALSVLLSNKII